MIHKKCSKFPLSLFFSALLAACVVTSPAFASDSGTHYKPFVLAAVDSNTAMNSVVQSVSKKLGDHGFQVVGSYMPYAGATVIVVTSDALKKNAADSDYGAFGAIIRVGVTKTPSGIQVSYTNPPYMANAYQMKSNLPGVAAALKSALGFVKDFGSEKGLTADDLRDYHYKWLMPYFTDRLKLTSYYDYQTAMKKVEASLKSNKAGVTQVYRVDIPGKQESIIGVKLPGNKGTECSGDKYIMSRIDFKKDKATAHLPYEIVVNKGQVVALPAEFRIAIDFPDLSMIGSNSFASIMCAPDAIKTALTEAVGGGDSDD